MAGLASSGLSVSAALILVRTLCSGRVVRTAESGDNLMFGRGGSSASPCCPSCCLNEMGRSNHLADPSAVIPEGFHMHLNLC